MTFLFFGSVLCQEIQKGNRKGAKICKERTMEEMEAGDLERLGRLKAVCILKYMYELRLIIWLTLPFTIIIKNS